jgi:pimeloyl-ACP methyl ester carboxylesterase
MANLASAAQEGAGPNGWSELRAVELDSASLKYIERGDGAPIIFVHGGLADYREWIPVAEQLDGYRTIVYSRRYNWPNEKAPTRHDHSARVEASDLAGFIEALEIGAVHIVGVSYGGYAALVLALERPDLVRTLTVAEPALVGWLRRIDGGAEVYDDFMNRMWLPSGAAARLGDAEGSIRIALDYFVGADAWSQFPPEVQMEILKNEREWTMLTTSVDAFPDKTPQTAAALQMPLLIISGDKSLALSKIIDAELQTRLPSAARVIIPDATHQMCTEQPTSCAAAIRSFLNADK